MKPVRKSHGKPMKKPGSATGGRYRWQPPKKALAGPKAQRAAVLQAFLSPGHVVPLKSLVRTSSHNGFISHETARKMLNGFLSESNWFRKVGGGGHTKYALTPNAVKEIRAWIERTGIMPESLDSRFIESGFEVKKLEPSEPFSLQRTKRKKGIPERPATEALKRKAELKRVLSSVRRGNSTAMQIIADTGLSADKAAHALRELQRRNYLLSSEEGGQLKYSFNQEILRLGVIGGPIEKRSWFGRDLRGEAGRQWNSYLLKKLEAMPPGKRSAAELARAVGRGLSEQRIRADLERLEKRGLVSVSKTGETRVFSPKKK